VSAECLLEGVSGNRLSTSIKDSFSSRMNAVMYTSPTTLGVLAPATVITAPPYDWPTRMTGPSISLTTLAM